MNYIFIHPGDPNSSLDICEIKPLTYSVECLQRKFCPQISNHFHSLGINSVVGALLILGVKWLFLSWLYKRFNLDWDLEFRRRINDQINLMLLAWCVCYMVSFLYYY